MKLNEYAAKLKALAEKYPDLDVIYSKDDEGNGYSKVHYDPTPGIFEDGDFQNIKGKQKPNAICLN